MSANIICRIDPTNNKPVVFVTDQMDYDKGEILSWIAEPGQDAEIKPLTYYQITNPVSEADEKVLVERYMEKFGEKEITVRHKLPRRAKPTQSFLSGNTGSALVDAVHASIKVPPVSGNTAVDFVAALEALRASVDDKFRALIRAATPAKK
jgi:hypothetical protein